jgi:hypothetical protein
LEQPFLADGVVGVEEGQGQWIAKHRSGFLERYPVLGEIRRVPWSAVLEVAGVNIGELNGI